MPGTRGWHTTDMSSPEDPLRPDPVVLLAGEGRALLSPDLAERLAPWWSVVVIGWQPEEEPTRPDLRLVHGASLIGVLRDRGVAGSARAFLARAKGTLHAWRNGARPSLVWALKSDTGARSLLRGAGVVVALDVPAERAVGCVPDLTRGIPVVSAEEAQAWVSSISSLASVLRDLEGSADIDEDLLANCALRLRGITTPDIPGGVAAVAAVARAVRLRHGLMPGARVVEMLDTPSWPSPERDAAGLAAQRLSADLTLGRVSQDQLSDEAAAQVVRTTLAAADAALPSAPDEALALLSDSLALLLHRARHAEVARSPLVDDPAAFLADVLDSDTWAALIPEVAAPKPAPRARTRRARALVVAGSYGTFHRGVAQALSDDVEVRIRDFTAALPVLGPKMMDGAVIGDLAGWIGHQRGAPHLRRDLTDADDAVREGLRGMTGILRWADVVFSDWADRSTVWLSHACPPDTRLIVRVHALDALDPWIHLVCWDRVDQVVVVSEPWRRLVLDILGAHGVDVPVSVLGNVVEIGEMHRPKHPSARLTLGMVGWGRVVKDPAWALDLLAREPSWRLRLIGAPFSDRPAPSTHRYVTSFRDRMDEADLRGRVDIVGRTADVAGELQHVGVILSTSVRESWHVGLVEGAASGAVPVVRDWPLLASRGGARTIFPTEWVVDDLDSAENRVRHVTQPEVWAEESARARSIVGDLFDPERVAAAYRDLVLRS